MAFENVGSHIGCMSELFSNHVLGPLLIDALQGKTPTTQPVGNELKTPAPQDAVQR
jgi:hypothetical protein